MGVEYLQDIVDAIRNKNVLRIQYQSYNRSEPKKHTVHPYFIKEYQGRMYLIGKDIHATKASIFLTFSFDRMKDVIQMNTTFMEEDVDKENYFNSAIGISLPGSKPEKIILKFNVNQANYIKSQPLHHSQKIIKDTKTEFIISIHVVINYELKTLLLGFGNQLKVQKPEHLADELSKNLKLAFEQYTKG
jgi:predicted DNA-binding transcriptional regulator YafY